MLKKLAVHVALLTWLPLSQALAAVSGNHTPVIATLTKYHGEGIIIASLVMLLIGSFLSMRYEPPIDVPAGNKMDNVTKFFFSISGGIVAFLYVLENSKSLTLLHPVWVFGVSVIAPSFVQIAFPIVVRIWYKFFKAKERKLGDDDL